jgi:anti-anti-sigma factor
MRVTGHGLSIAVVWTGDIVVVFLEGKLDGHSAPLLVDTLERLVPQCGGGLWLELAGVDRIDAVGAAAIARVCRLSSELGRECLLRSPSSAVALALAGARPD